MGRTGELQIERADHFAHLERRVQRVGILLLTLFVVAGALGAFGGGPLSAATATHGGIEVRYERFGRTTAPTSMAITIRAPARDGQPIRFRLDRAFVDNLGFLDVQPSDALTGFDGGSALFEIAAQGGAGRVELHYKPTHPGMHETAVRTDDGAAAHIWQFIYY